MTKKTVGRCPGFSLLELLIIMGIMSAVAAISLPSLQRTLKIYRISGDARAIAQTLTYAKTRAAANFTIESVGWDTVNNTFSIQYFQKTIGGSQYQGQLQPDSSAQSLNLSNGDSLGPPSSGVSSTVGADGSSGILFNSRGLPVDNSFNPVNAPQAFYLNNGVDYYAVSVAVSGRVQTWKYVDSAWVVQ